MMTRKQKLRNAVVLGLLLSSITASSAWAEKFDVTNIENDNASGTQYDEITGILGNMYYYGLVGGTDEYIEYTNSKIYDSINITLKNNYNIWPGKNKKAVGVTSKTNADAVLKANSDITIDVQTRNTEDGFGILADDSGHQVYVDSENGSINISAVKTNGVQCTIFGPKPGEINYSTADVYGIKVINDGVINLTAGQNIIITAGYDKDAAEKYNTLKQGNIYGVSNINSTVNLTAGEGIRISATSADGDAYGIYADSDKETVLNGKVNIIEAVADGNGTAVGITAENGSKVNITGDTVVSGDDGGMVIKGNSSGTTTLADGQYQVTVDGDLQANAQDGAAISLDNASMLVTGNEIIDNTLDIKNDSHHEIKGSLSGVVNGKTAVNVDNSNLTIGGNIGVEGADIGLDIKNSSNVTINGENGYGFNYVGGGQTGVSVDASVLTVNDAITLIAGGQNGLVLNNGAKSEFTGTTVIKSLDENSTAVKVQAGSEFVNNGAVQVQGGQYGFLVTDSTANIKAENGVNFFIASGFREDVTDEANEGNFSNAVNVGSGASFSASGAGNVLQAGEVVNGYGNETAVSVREGEFSLGAGSVGNMIAGAIYAAGNNAAVDITAGSGGNYIFSSTHGRTGDSVHLVSAVYAADNSNINISAGKDGVNVIRSYAELHTDKDNGGHFDKEGNLLDREITVWAENGSSVNIGGAVFIAASNNSEYTLNEDGDPVKGNALGIAVSAGGRSLEYNTDGDANSGLKPVENISNVNIDYASNIKESSIIGDIVAGYGGEVNIGQNLVSVLDGKTVSNGGDSSLKIKGNILAGNGGVANVDLGNGGLWIGRADDYQDASNGHETFYNPAFSNEIVDSGTVNVTMGEGSQWILTGQSWISSLTANNALVDMTATDEDSGDKYTHSLVIDTFNGNGTTFVMDFDTEDHKMSDMLYIAEGKGTYNVNVANALDENALLSDGLRIATVSEGISVDSVVYDGTGFKKVFYSTSEEGYEKGNNENSDYNGDNVNGNEIQSLDNTQNSNYNNGKPGEDFIDSKFDANDKNIVINGIIGRENSVVGDAVIAMSRANYSNAVYMDRFNKRMGEARFIDGDEGVWVRMRHDRIGKEDAFRSQNTMYELGYDVKQANDGGENRFGFAIDYMDGETEYSNVGGTGEISRKGIWMYDSWLGNKGHYTDFIAKWGHLSNDFDITAANGTGVQGDYSNNVFSFSAEYGKKNDIGHNWYFEPQAQLQYAHVTGAEYVTSAGTEVRLDGIDSLIARAGFRLGRDISNHSTVYFKGDVLHEFMGDQDLYVKDASYNGSAGYENDGTWYDLGFGFATKVNKASYAYLDFEKSFGNDNDETYQINAGMQWSF